jgi:Ca-activated chloride channel family protein
MSGSSYSPPQGNDPPANNPPRNNPPPNNPPPGQGFGESPEDEPYPDVYFQNPGTNPFVDTGEDRESTFGLDVDTASYAVARRFLHDGNIPDPDSVRVEEFVNAFPTGWQPPERDPFAIHVDGARSPFGGDGRFEIARIAILGREVHEEDRPPVALTFVIDVSGSMDMENRLGLVKQSLGILVEELRPRDSVAIVAYGDHARVVLPPTPIAERGPIFGAIDSLRPEGATNAEAGLLLGYEVARQGYRRGAINRVILASDGVANVGNTGPDAILAQIRDEATNHIGLVALGFGMGNYNDVLMEQLANDGDGFYAYVDTLDEAQRLFIDELASTLVPLGRDAKVQVQWDPDTVRQYRLVGFENRSLADEDFRDDTVEAGAIGAGHAVTALYELELYAGSFGESLGTVTLRWTDPGSGETSEISESLESFDLAASFRGADRHFRLATVAAAFAEVLRGSYWSATVGLEDVRAEARALVEEFPEDESVRELAELVERAAELERYP